MQIPQAGRVQICGNQQHRIRPGGPRFVHLVRVAGKIFAQQRQARTQLKHLLLHISFGNHNLQRKQRTFLQEL
jgi:hypothetical protein